MLQETVSLGSFHTCAQPESLTMYVHTTMRVDSSVCQVFLMVSTDMSMIYQAHIEESWKAYVSSPHPSIASNSFRAMAPPVDKSCHAFDAIYKSFSNILNDAAKQTMQADARSFHG